jgi:N-ethylmaleimide reductase
VSLDAIGYINTAGIHTDEQVEGWKKSNQACFMIKVGKSLFNCGMWDVCLILIFITGHYHYLHQLSIPNDNILLQKDLKLLLRKEMTVEDIKTTVKDFQNAAELCKAGFDG